MPNLVPPGLAAAWGGLSGNIRGSLLMLVNALIFSIMVALIKVSSASVPITLVMFFSVATQFLFIGLRHFRGFGRAVMGSKLRGAHLLRVFLLVSSMYAGFSAVVLLPLAEATAISFSKAFFVTLFAAILLKEVVGPRRWLAVAIGFGGILILARPGGSDLSVAGAALAVISAATAAAGSISTRFLAQRDPASLLLLYQTAFGTLMLTPVAIWNWVSPDLATLGVLVATGLLSVIGNTSMIMALKIGEASALAPVDFTRAVFAVLIGLVLLGEVPTLTAVIGTFVVIAAALLSLSRAPACRSRPTLPEPTDTRVDRYWRPIMSFDDLPPQTPINPNADRYAETCLEQSRKVAETTRCVLDVAYGPDYWQKIDIYLPDEPRAGHCRCCCSSTAATSPTATRNGAVSWRRRSRHFRLFSYPFPIASRHLRRIAILSATLSPRSPMSTRILRNMAAIPSGSSSAAIRPVRRPSPTWLCVTIPAAPPAFPTTASRASLR